MDILRFYNGRMRCALLGNGLKVLIHEEHTAPLASVWCWYKAGSKDERPGLTGVSHWVEHMNFKGTTNIPRDQVKGIIEQFGGTWNGYTWIDQTTYFETATRDALDRMLFIESERMANCLYHPDDCESERTVIISELQGGDNDPDQLLDQELTATAFKAHPYRHPTIGWLPDLQTMTRDDLYGYYRRYYVPNNATLVIVGDVETDVALRRAEHHFGAIQPGAEVSRIRTVEPEQTGERRLTIRKPGTTAYLKVGYHAPSATDGHFFPLLILDAVLTGAKGLNLWSSFRGAAPQRSTRLYRALVERGIASWVGGSLLPTEQPFLYTISATVTDGTPLPSAESTLLEELDRVERGGITDAELTKAKAQLRARLVFDSDSVTNIAHQLGYFETIGGVESFTTLAPRIAAVTVDEVNAAARAVLPSANRTIGWFDPLPVGEESAK
ncbi:MAG: insulinase family protein [Acidobacteria bacterium]|nr:MAG: insulinase family protein [Acidobacteriota bacterium]PYQ78547.1 MAG: insulinase family protein [Acidobacteriota bacterium]PYQ87012.1 MAG: insulinase family protein [Acidobacteriota bacterium]